MAKKKSTSKTTAAAKKAKPVRATPKKKTASPAAAAGESEMVVVVEEFTAASNGEMLEGDLAEFDAVHVIGHAAGTVWAHLGRSGCTSLADLAIETGLPIDLAMMAVGWLAREHKLLFTQQGSSLLVELC